jgi:hypothetical protein
MKEHYFYDLKLGDRFKSEPLNVTVRKEQRKKLEQLAAFEKHSVSNLIEVMADERWKRLVEQQGMNSLCVGARLRCEAQPGHYRCGIVVGERGVATDMIPWSAATIFPQCAADGAIVYDPSFANRSGTVAVPWRATGRRGDVRPLSALPVVCGAYAINSESFRESLSTDRY